MDEEEAAQRRQEAFSRSVQGFNSRKNSNIDDAPFSKEELALMSIRGGAKKVVGTPVNNNNNNNFGGDDSTRKQQAQ